MAELHRRGYKVAVVSGGFHETVDVLAKRIGLDYVKANRLEVKDGVLTGKVLGEVVTKDVKKASLIEWAAENGLELSQTIAMGDGANDLPMIKTAGIGIAFCAKPVVRKEAPYQINEADLYKVIDILDGKTSDVTCTERKGYFMRQAEIERNTFETKIKLSLNLDAQEPVEIDTGVGFLTIC